MDLFACFPVFPFILFHLFPYGGFYVKGSRVPLDSIVHEFRNGASPESIRQAFPTLTLEQVYGAITLYLGHQGEVEASIWEAEEAWTEFEATHPLPPGNPRSIA